jgi:hypothetical protein
MASPSFTRSEPPPVGAWQARTQDRPDLIYIEECDNFWAEALPNRLLGQQGGQGIRAADPSPTRCQIALRSGGRAAGSNKLRFN